MGLLFSGDSVILPSKSNQKRMDITLVFTVALAAAFIVVLVALVIIILYQRWRIGDQNVFIERFIRQNEEQRQKLKKAGINIKR
jgi:cytochrome c-type biogenesis protein CcmH/NrfG